MEGRPQFMVYQEIYVKLYVATLCVEGRPQVMVYLGTYVKKMWQHNACEEGRPQVMVYPVTYEQQHMATYNVWRVDHKLWSTNKYICRTIRGNTCNAWRVEHKLWSTNKYICRTVRGSRGRPLLYYATNGVSGHAFRV